MASPVSPVQMLAEDAADTVRRIRRDAQHLKDLGKLTVAGIRAVAARVRQRTEHAIDQAADAVGEVADAYHGRPRVRRTPHGRRGGR